MKSSLLWLLVLIGISVASGAAAWMLWPNPSDEQPTTPTRPEKVDPNDLVDTIINPRQGVVTPTSIRGEFATLDDDEEVIGIVVGGEARAYLVSAMSMDNPEDNPGKHVVNDSIANRPITVTYCDHSNCANVFQGEAGQSALEVGVHGWIKGKGMILTHEGENFAQSSQDGPLKTMEFVLTTWNDWYQKHPDTRLYFNPPRNFQ